ncbi:Hypothetical_protein [Hexamita inflata]|uniref:Hypothetical_protein n=1 Tax=Hexamita inflata TaxID=28002 RepID=A0AA86RGF1_9EUKA|nr:Hypothetical protein HINF_LOCUS61331 [Hexamita inflata]
MDVQLRKALNGSSFAVNAHNASQSVLYLENVDFIDYIYINSLKLQNSCLHFSGNNYPFELSGLDKINGRVDQISFRNCKLDLNQFVRNVRRVCVNECEVSGKQLFKCQSLSVIASGFVDLSWINAKCESIKLLVSRTESRIYSQLKHFTQIQNLTEVLLVGSDVDLSAFNVSLQKLALKQCVIQNESSPLFKVGKLSVHYSQLLTSQLKKSKISHLQLESDRTGIDYCNDCSPLGIIIDDLPNLNQLNAYGCQVCFKPSALFKINSLKLQLCDFRFCMRSLKFFLDVAELETDFFVGNLEELLKQRAAFGAERGLKRFQQRENSCRNAERKEYIFLLQLVFDGVCENAGVIVGAE